MILTETKYWIPILDGDPRAVSLFKRHYTARNTDYVRFGFSGKGQSLILMTVNCDALFCWRLVIGVGVNCSVFRNESGILSSELIKEADELAWDKWQESRHYTYVNPLIVHGDGRCFKIAGWKKLKNRTKKNNLIELEIYRQQVLI